MSTINQITYKLESIGYVCQKLKISDGKSFVSKFPSEMMICLWIKINW